MRAMPPTTGLRPSTLPEKCFGVPNGELGLCLGSTHTGDYAMMARRVNDGIYVKKMRPKTCAGPLKVDYDYMGRSVEMNPHTTQEGTCVYGSRPLGVQNTKSYKEMSQRVQDGLYVKIFGYVSWRNEQSPVHSTQGHSLCSAIRKHTNH